jgi:hypothetical protein
MTEAVVLMGARESKLHLIVNSLADQNISFSGYALSIIRRSPAM